jgi:hypothetical protein
MANLGPQFVGFADAFKLPVRQTALKGTLPAVRPLRTFRFQCRQEFFRSCP